MFCLWLQMAKSVKELKKENTFLKSKCEKSDISLIELVEEVISHFLSISFYLSVSPVPFSL